MVDYSEQPELLLADVMKDETIDELRDYDLRIIQPRSGYRFSVDPLLLCEFAGTSEGEMIDLGTGCSVIPLIMARKNVSAHLTGVDFKEESAQLALRNVDLNDLSTRVKIIFADILELKGRFPVSSFDLVLSNPPYRAAGSGKISPHAGRDTARHETTAKLVDFLQIAKYLVKPAGRICMIYHVSRLAELIAQASLLKLSLLRLQFVHGKETDCARMVLLEMAKGRTRELTVLPPLFVRSASNH